MAQISRSTKVNGGTTLTASTTARAVDVETDMATLVNAHNNHDSGSSSWTVVKAAGATSVPLDVDNSTGTQNIATFKDNGAAVLAIKDGGQLQAADGSVTAPEYGFASDTDNGMYLIGANNVGFAAGGTKRLDISSTAITSALPVAMGANKITGLADGTVATDAAAFGQLPTISTWTLYTPTITGCGTVTANSAYWRQVGKTIQVKGYFICGTVSGAIAFSIGLPGSVAFDNTKTLPSSLLGNGVNLGTTGTGSTALGASNIIWLFTDDGAANLVFGSIRSNAGLFETQFGSGVFANSQACSYSFEAPVA